jgi:hypothetical protein
MFPKNPSHHSFNPSMFPRDLSIIPFISLMLQHQVLAGKGGVFSMFPKKYSIILFISACSQEIFPSFPSSLRSP